VFTPVFLSLDDLIVTKSTPRGVCSLAHDRHFGVELQEHISKGVFQRDVMYLMGTRCNALFVLRCCHVESKWYRRMLKVSEQLQIYDISDMVLNRLDEEALVAHVNVQGGVDALFSVLPGAGGILINRRVQMLKVDLPSIFSSGVSQKEQQDICLGRDPGVSEVENDATKHDD
jgi:hypothetical protein